MSTVAQEARLTCGQCNHAIPIPNRRVGDMITCANCQSRQVILRSKVLGEVPPAVVTGLLNARERGEVDDALERIKRRRLGRAQRHATLYPSWAVLASVVQFYLAGILAGQNLIEVGQVQRGRRLKLLGILLYALTIPPILALALFGWTLVPQPVHAALLVGVSVLATLFFTTAQARACSSARAAGARDDATLAALPLVVAAVLMIAQAFAVWFIRLHLDSYWAV